MRRNDQFAPRTARRPGATRTRRSCRRRAAGSSPVPPPRIERLAGDAETAGRFGHVPARLVEDEGDVGVRKLAERPGRAGEFGGGGVDRGSPGGGRVVRGRADDVLELGEVAAPGGREKPAARGRRE